jgi:hypothetical protein
LGPFHIVHRINPDAKKLTIILKDMLEKDPQRSLYSLASAHGLELITKTNQERLTNRELFRDTDGIFFDQGLLFISMSSAQNHTTGPVVLLTDRSIEFYNQMEQLCLSAVPTIDKVLDTDSMNPHQLSLKLKQLKPSVIICIGSNSYQLCKTMRSSCKIVFVLKTPSAKDGMAYWCLIDGVKMTVEPKRQIELLAELTKKPIRLAVPYTPQHSEYFVFKAIVQSETTSTKFAAIAISESKNLTAKLQTAFEKYDGVWLTPDPVFSSAVIHKFVLAESLKKKENFLSA